jgi:hypothetical protein
VGGSAVIPVTRSMRITLAAMTVAASMILVDQTAVPLATRAPSMISAVRLPNHSGC